MVRPQTKNIAFLLAWFMIFYDDTAHFISMLYWRFGLPRWIMQAHYHLWPMKASGNVAYNLWWFMWYAVVLILLSYSWSKKHDR